MQRFDGSGRGWTRSQLARAIAPLALAACVMPAFAQTLTWDATPQNPATPNDGSGNWNTTVDSNWSNGASDSVWVNGDVAAIGNGGTAGTITINDPLGTVNATGVSFNPVSAGSYTIAASGANTLTLIGGATISTAAGVTGTIAAPIAGSAGLSYSSAGTLNLNGNNTFTGTTAINGGTITVGAGGNLGASGNLVSLGTPNTGTSINDPVGNLNLQTSATVGSFKAATNNSAINTLTIASGATMNVTSNSALTGLNSTVNGAFIVGSPNAGAAMVTNLTISGAGTLAVDGGSNNSSFLVGLGNSNSSANSMTPNLNMSGLANFSFTTGTGAIPAGGGNEFAVGHGAGAQATASLAVNNTIVAGIITVGDHSNTPGLTGAGPNAPASAATLNFGSGANVLRANNIVIGNVRSQSNAQWASGVTTGTLLITGAAGGASAANITVGVLASGTPPSTASKLTLDDHDVTVQAGTVIVGNMAGATGGTSTTKGGSISFNTGVFNIADLTLAQGTSGTSTGSICGTFSVGSGPSSTGVLNVTNSFKIGAATGGTPTAKGTFNVKGGTANISSNIIDVSTIGTSNTTVALTGGTLNMGGFAIGPKVAAGNTGAVGTRNLTTMTFPSLGNNAVLMNLGGTGINDAGLNLNGTGVLIVEGNNNYTGGTTITSGVLQVGAASDVASPSSALQGNVTDNAVLAFGSSQPLTVSNLISGSGGVAQTGPGTTTVTNANSYAGATTFVAGALNVNSLPCGGVNSPLGSSSNAAGNLLFSGGTLKYSGAGDTSGRLFTITATGGSIDSSGSGALVLNNGGAAVSADAPARAATTSITTPKVTLNNVYDLVVGMTVTGANIPAGTTISAINPAANSITLSNTPTVAGADTFNFGISARAFTLTGSSSAANTMSNVLSDSAGGATLSLVKSGTGSWRLTGANSFTGATTVNGGTLQLGTAAQNPVLTGAGGADIRGGRIVFEYSGSSIAPTIESLLTSSYNTNGFNNTTSRLRSTAATGSRGLGWVDDTPNSAVHVAAALYGDSNLDGKVDLTDFTYLAANFNTQSGATWLQGDYNYDDHVDLTDFTFLASNFNMVLSAPAADLGAAVPEPASIAILGVASLGLRRRRTR